MADYISKYTGEEVDLAVAKALGIDDTLQEYQKKLTMVETEAAEITLEGWVMYRSINVPSLTVKLPEGSHDDGKDYLLEIKVSYDDFSLSLPSDIMWINNKLPQFVNGKTYQLSILNNCIVMGEW